MENRDYQRNKVSWHLRDLLKRDPEKVQEVCNWLEKRACTNRDRANRSGSRRMLARMVAAQICLKAAKDGDVAAAREVMDRTEGKVADRLELVDLNKLVEQLEASRQRVISASTEPLPVVVDGEIVAEHVMSTNVTPEDTNTSK